MPRSRHDRTMQKGCIDRCSALPVRRMRQAPYLVLQGVLHSRPQRGILGLCGVISVIAVSGLPLSRQYSGHSVHDERRRKQYRTVRMIKNYFKICTTQTILHGKEELVRSLSVAVA
jgi:hypothetical protein